MSLPEAKQTRTLAMPDQRCICKFISSGPGIMLAFRLASKDATRE